MKKGKRVITLVLVFALLLGQVNAFAGNEQGTRQAEKGKSEARAALEFQVQNAYQPEDTLEVMVELKEEYFQNLGRNYTGEELQDAINFARQVEFSKRANEKALNEIQRQGIQLSEVHSFEFLWFGFSAKLSYQDALKLADMEAVKAVKPAVTYEQPKTNFFNDKVRMIHSREIVGQDKVYSKYKGEGTVIAVIDSGFDTTHPAFYISDQYKDSVKIKQADVEKLIQDKAIAGGQYINEKIPFAYNYERKNNAIKEVKIESHGQHVAGTSAGNVVQLEQGTFSGIAPEAQFLAMRVFPDSGGTQDIIYARAMEDAVKLGADSMNLSLGASAGSLADVSTALEEVVNKAAEMGIVIAIAAGNDSHFGKSVSNPKATEPDYGIMSSPAVVPKSLAVASYSNTKIMQNYMTLTRGEVSEEIGFVQPSDSNLKFKEETLEVVYSKLGQPDDFPEEVRGKYALIERGAITFTDKINNAAAKGAVGAIIFNHAAGGNDFIGMSAVGSKIPAASIQRDVALRIIENISEYRIKMNNKIKAFDSKTAGYISDFSNWGVTAEGDLKPEIMAPGGNIYSTIANNLYGTMSGTSMASPHVAGGIVLVKSRVNQEFADYTGVQKYELVKNLLMSTATPHVNLDTKTFSSPRNQGAGIMNLQGALSTQVIVYDKTTKNSKLNLGDVEEKFTLRATLKNLGDTPAKYRYKTYVLTDQVIGDYITLDPRELAVVEGQEVTVAANAEQEVVVEVDTSAYTEELTKKMPNGYFLDGFIVFENADEANPQPNLSIPFLGFKGNFGGLQNLEPFVYTLAEEGRLPKYYQYNKDGSFEKRDFTHFFTAIDGAIKILGQADDFNPARPQFGKLVFSPNGDEKADELAIGFTVLRNISNIQIKLFAAEDRDFTTPLATLFELSGNFRKNFFSGDVNKPKSYSTLLKTEEVEKSTFADGLYKIVVQTQSRVANADPDREVLDFYVDRKAPQVEDIKFDEETRQLTFTVTDEVSGVKKEEVTFEENGRRFYLKKEGEGYRIPAGVVPASVQIHAEDFGFNQASYTIGSEIVTGEFGSLMLTADVTPSGSPLPSFTERIVSADNPDAKWTKEKLPFGKYLLYIEDIAGGYQLKGENPIAFEVSKDAPVAYKTVVFEEIKSKLIALRIPDEVVNEVTIRATSQQDNKSFPFTRFRFGGKDTSYYVTNLPYGSYQIHFEVATKGKTLVLLDKSGQVIANNVLTVDENTTRFDSWDTRVVVDTKKSIRIVTEPANLAVEYHVYSLSAKREETDLNDLANGAYLVFPKETPAGYRADAPALRVVIDSNTPNPEVIYAFSPAEVGVAKVSVTDNRSEYDVNPEYLLVDLATFLGFGDKKYALKDNPDVPFGRYVFTPDKETYDSKTLEIAEEDFVTIDKAQTTLTATWREQNEAKSYLNLEVEYPEELGSLNLEFYGKYKLPVTLQYNKADYKTHNALLRHDTYQVVVKDLPEGYVVTPSEVRISHKGDSVLRFAVAKEADAPQNPLPKEYGFGRILVVVQDEENNLVTDVEAKLYHNDNPVDLTKDLPYGYYEARLENLDQTKYRAVKAKEEVSLNKDNRLITIALTVERVAVKDKLVEELDKAKQIDTTKYTAESVAALKEAIAAAEKVNADANVNQKAVNEALAKLANALRNLTVPVYVPYIPAPAPSSPTPTPTTPQPSDGKGEAEIGDSQIPLGDAGFKDVAGDAWYAKAVQFVKAKGLMQGVSQELFAPSQAVSRAMVVTILYRLENEPDLGDTLESFTDVKDGNYYTKAVKWASAHKIVLGFGDGTFRPEVEITREQLAHILAKYATHKKQRAELKLQELNFADQAEVSAYAKESVLWATQEAVLSGRGDGMLAPKATTTRAELAKVLQNLLEKTFAK